MKFAVYLVIIILVSACVERDSSNPTPSNPPKSPIQPIVVYDNYGDDFTSGVIKTVEKIHQYLDEIPDCNSSTIENEENSDVCKMTQYSVQTELQPETEEKQLHQSSTNNVTARSNNVLIIDSGLEAGSIGYPRRMLGMYDWTIKSLEGNITVGYQNTLSTYTTSKAQFKIRNQLIGQSNSFVPATETTRHIIPQKIWKLPDDPATDTHGTITLNALANYLPHAQFTTIGLFKFPDEIICNPDADSLEDFVFSTLSVIGDIVQRHNVSYINLSSGKIKQDFKDLIKSTCKTASVKEESIIALHTAYARLLIGISDLAVLVQAGPNSSAPMISHVDNHDTSAEYYSDCIDIPNRLTTGYIVQGYIDDPELPIIDNNGSNYSESYDVLFRPNQFQVKGCIDAFINTGWRENYLDFPSFGHFPILYGIDGISAAPLNFMSTSFTSAIAIALVDYYAINNSLTPRAALQFLKNKKDTINTAILFDPMRYGQLPLCNYFPDACKNWEQFEFPL